MAKVNEKKKSLRINTIGVIGPCMAIPVTPKFVVKLCEAKYECENISFDSHVKDLITALYDAVMENDEEPEQDKKDEPEPDF